MIDIYFVWLDYINHNPKAYRANLGIPSPEGMWEDPDFLSETDWLIELN